MKWIKASERLPEWRVKVSAIYGRSRGELIMEDGYITFDAKGTHVTLNETSRDLRDILWLDETPDEGATLYASRGEILREALEAIKNYTSHSESFDFQYINGIATEALTTYSSKQ